MVLTNSLFSLRDINLTLGLLPPRRHVVWRDSVSVESSRSELKSKCADIFHQSFFWLLRRTEEPQRGRNCLRRRRSKPSSAWAGSVLISFGVVLMSCRVNFHVVRAALGSNNVFERRTSTGSGLFSFFDGGFAQIFSQIASMTVKKLRNTNFISSRHVKRENTSLPVDMRRSKTSLLKLPNVQIQPYLNKIKHVFFVSL